MKTESKFLTMEVAGIQYRVSVSTRRMIGNLIATEIVECELEREPKNEHDANAIKVILKTKPYDGFHIGYVPRQIASVRAPVLDAGVHVIAAVLDEWDAEEGTGRLSVTLKTPEQAKSTPVKKKSPKKT